MKIRFNLLLGSLLVIAMTQASQGAALTLDSDTGTTGARDSGGTWTTGLGDWWNSSANVNRAATDTATFGAGTDGTLTLSGNNSYTGDTIQEIADAPGRAPRPVEGFSRGEENP